MIRRCVSVSGSAVITADKNARRGDLLDVGELGRGLVTGWVK